MLVSARFHAGKIKLHNAAFAMLEPVACLEGVQNLKHISVWANSMLDAKSLSTITVSQAS